MESILCIVAVLSCFVDRKESRCSVKAKSDATGDFHRVTSYHLTSLIALLKVTRVTIHPHISLTSPNLS